MEKCVFLHTFVNICGQQMPLSDMVDTSAQADHRHSSPSMFLIGVINLRCHVTYSPSVNMHERTVFSQDLPKQVHFSHDMIELPYEWAG